MKSHTLDLDPRSGSRTCGASWPSGTRRSASSAQEELRAGHSPDMVKARYSAHKPPRDSRLALEAERQRLEAAIERLTKRLKEVAKRLTAIEKGGSPRGAG